MAIAHILGLLLAAASPATKWVTFETLPDGVIYINPASVKRQGTQADMWVLIDYKVAQPDKAGKSVKSDTLHYRYDCKGKQFTLLATTAHAGPMGTGEIVDANPELPPKSPVPPNTTADRMWQRACGVAAK
jgi:hypothetical protein